MTCKNCLSFEKCLELGEVVVNVRGGNHICKHFKNKNGYAKLPCEVGDTVYIIRDWPCVDICKGCEHFKQDELDVLSECGKNKFTEDECQEEARSYIIQRTLNSLHNTACYYERLYQRVKGDLDTNETLD